MKKVVLVGLVLVVSFAGSAFAAKDTIVGSAHDMSVRAAGDSDTVRADAATNFDRICAWCHTPHAARTGVFAPLWNRSSDYDTATNLYNSSTTTSVVNNLAATGITGLAGTDVVLCLTCHDGNIAGTGGDNSLQNVPNGLTDPGAAGFATTGTAFSTDAQVAGDAAGLQNDHPVGFNYETAQGEDADLHTRADASNNYGIEFFGAANNIMWCSSCHDVHRPGSNADGDYPFLATSNAGSQLCLACHNK